MKTLWIVFSLLVITGCAGIQRDCSSSWASQAGADWVIAQYKYDGTPIYCWKLKDVAIENESHSDGIYWKDSRTGHLIHLSGWYNRVQVVGDKFDEAAQLIGCK
jgi:hypothetical protein